MAVLMNSCTACLPADAEYWCEGPFAAPLAETHKAGDIERYYGKSAPSGSGPLYPPCSCMG